MRRKQPSSGDERQDAFWTMGCDIISVPDFAGKDPAARLKAWEAAKDAMLASYRELRFTTHPDRAPAQHQAAAHQRFVALEQARNLVDSLEMASPTAREPTPEAQRYPPPGAGEGPGVWPPGWPEGHKEGGEAGRRRAWEVYHRGAQYSERARRAAEGCIGCGAPFRRSGGLMGDSFCPDCLERMGISNGVFTSQGRVCVECGAPAASGNYCAEHAAKRPRHEKDENWTKLFTEFGNVLVEVKWVERLERILRAAGVTTRRRP